MKPIKESFIKTRRKFDETFHREAVHNWLANDKSAAVIAHELGLHADRLYAWKKRFAPEGVSFFERHPPHFSTAVCTYKSLDHEPANKGC